MARTGLFHRDHKHTHHNDAETREYGPDSPGGPVSPAPSGGDRGPGGLRGPGGPGGPAVVGHDDAIDRSGRSPEDVDRTRQEGIEHHRHTEEGRRAALRDTYGGFNWGACFFGWLVAVGLTVLLGAIISAVASAVGANQGWTQADLEANPGSLGIAAAITLAVVMFIGYFAGGYVAARMSRFDAGRQGLGVWIVGLAVTIIAAVAGALFGSSYDIMQQLDLPSVGLSTDQLGWGAVLAVVALLVVMLVGALLGAATGRRYHSRIDKATYDF
ncbi:MAG: hypothetical protein ACRDPS_18305 [Nocardioides sp.]|uniref:hypothetical protein n=1 Tax=Nocardioides sp. TaxID=35761 RepID=UPI003D6A6FA7